MLTIGFAIQEWPAPGKAAGGAGIYVAKIARALAARGHAVHVVTCAHAGLPASADEDGVRLHRLGIAAPNARDPEALMTYSRAVAERLRALDVESPFDIVEFQEWAAEGWAFHPRRDQAMIVRLQAPSHFVRQFEYADGTPAERQVDELERWPVERADLVTAPSRLIADFAARSWSFDPAAVTIIPNGVDAGAFGEAAPGASSGPVVLCVNRLSPIKGPETFVRAAAIIHRAHPSARFRMIGRVEAWNGVAGDVRLRSIAESEGLPADRLEILGPADHASLPALYAQAEVCVNPSHSESYSLTSAEALAAGKACVLSRAMGITEFLHDGVDVLIATTGDANAFAVAVTRLLDDAELRSRMGAAARRTVQEHLSTEATVVATEAAYHAAITRVRARHELPKTRINIAMLTFNALEYTKRCLESIAATTPHPYQVFVLDNASTDGTRGWLASLDDPRIHVAFSDHNRGVPGGRNALLRTILPHLGNDGFIVFVDNDLELGAAWYEAPLAWFDAQARGGIAGEVGHPIVAHAERRELLPMPYETPADVDVASGGFCCFVRAACAREIGLFDEKLGLFWHEDDDYCVRAIMHGWQVVALRAGCVVHHEHKSGVALPGVATDGSPPNQRYLVAKWRSLGLVDDDGRIRRKNGDPTLALRTAVARRLGRGDPLPSDELERAARDLSALLMSGDVLAHIEGHAPVLSPSVCALLAHNLAAARAAGDQRLAGALAEVYEVVMSCRVSALLRKHVDLPPGPSTSPRGLRRLSKLCDARDWDSPEWRVAASAVMGDRGGRNWYARHRKHWEGGQVAYALERLLGAGLASASGLVVNAGVEPIVFGLANRVRSVTAVDDYGVDPSAPAAMLVTPAQFAPVPYKQNRLWVAKMSGDDISFPDESFDFVVVCGVHRGGEIRAARTLAACARAVRPAGPVIVVADVAINGAVGSWFFTPAELGRTVVASDLHLVDEIDFTIADATLDAFVDLEADPCLRPHLVLAAGDVLLTSAVATLERVAAATAVG